MKCLLIILFCLSPLIIDWWREMCAYWEMEAKRREEEEKEKKKKKK